MIKCICDYFIKIKRLFEKNKVLFKRLVRFKLKFFFLVFQISDVGVKLSFLDFLNLFFLFVK